MARKQVTPKVPKNSYGPPTRSTGRLLHQLLPAPGRVTMRGLLLLLLLFLIFLFFHVDIGSNSLFLIFVIFHVSIVPQGRSLHCVVLINTFVRAHPGQR